jgi:phage terminase large subunit-like protein
VPVTAPTASELKLSPEVAWYLQSRGIPLPTLDQAPLFKTPEPRLVASFDPDRVDRAIAAFRLMRHTQGKWAGRKLDPDPWQVAYIIAPVYGWVHTDSAGEVVRIIRTEYVDVPRKNGKTTLAGGQALYLVGADHEAGAQVYALAAGKDQAKFCFDPVKIIAEKSPDLGAFMKVTAARVVHKASGSYFTAVSSLADLMHGANIHGAVIDELHVHKTRDLVDAVETGTGARSQPLVIIITTPDDGRTGTIYDEKRRYCEQLSRGALSDPSFYGVIWGAAESEQHLADLGLTPFDEEAWRRANPGYGISPTREFLQTEAKKAQDNPANLARFLRLHCGIRTKQQTRYIELGVWDASAGLVDQHALEGKECYGGIDMASVNDLTALCWLFPDGSGSFDSIWRFWLPAAALPAVNKRTAGSADAWVRRGFLTITPGVVLDTDFVTDQLGRDAQAFQVLSVGYDRWGANDVIRKAAEGGLQTVGVGQGFASMNAPLKELLRLLLSKRLRHGGNPVMRWMIDNLAVRMDPAGNVKPDKDQSGDKIDGVSALVTAMHEYMSATAEAEGEVNLW